MDHRLLLNNIEPIHWALAGAGIAAVTLFLFRVMKHALGISTSFEDLCSLWSNEPYFQRLSLKASEHWRLYFLGGLFLGGVLSAVLGGGWHTTWNLGLFDERITTDLLVKNAWMFVGGLFIGFGTRLAGGCTSGHGIFGLSNFEKASLAAVISFMLAGLVTTNIVYRLIFP